MKPLIPLFLIGFLAGTFGYSGRIAPAQESRQDPRFEARVLAGQLQVRVTDRDGRLVQGIDREDFLVLEKGRQLPLVLFEERRRTGVGLAILVDVGSNMSQDSIRDAKQLIFDLVHLLDPEDEILTAIYDRDVGFLHELTTDRKVISDGLWNLPTGARSSKWQRLGNLWVSKANTGYAIDESLLKLKKTRHTDKVVLVISAGFGNQGKATLDHLRVAGAQLMAVSVRNRLGDIFSLGGDQAARRRSVDATGGIAFAGETVRQEIEQLRLAIKSYYLLGVSVGDSKGSLEVTIRIRDHPEYTVHAAPRTTSSSSFY